jgi:K+-sensing histidine kinase KdpD
MNQGQTDEYLIRLIDVSPKVAEQRSMWSFHGQVSHKLRTPLNHLFASLDMITDKDLEKLDPDIKAFFELAKQGAVRLKDEIQDIFKYIQITDLARKGSVGVNLAALHHMIEQIAHELDIKSCNARYEGIAQPAKQTTVISVEAIELIIWELLENAKKFHPKGTPAIEIAISTQQDETGEMAVIKVGDDGVNLSPTQLEKMWVPYYQAERYFTGQVQGAGLGLSLVTSILWGIGGTFRAQNRAQQPGIIVELKIPLTSSPD